MHAFITSHYEKVFSCNNTMPAKVYNILVDFDPYSETVNIVTKKCYPCKHVKEIDCFKRCYYTSINPYYYVKYTMTCSECLDETSLKG